jgi:hypothetical protein
MGKDEARLVLATQIAGQLQAADSLGAADEYAGGEDQVLR